MFPKFSPSTYMAATILGYFCGASTTRVRTTVSTRKAIEKRFLAVSNTWFNPSAYPKIVVLSTLFMADVVGKDLVLSNKS